MSHTDKGLNSIWSVTASICLISVLPRTQTQTLSTSFTVDFRALFDFVSSPSAEARQAAFNEGDGQVASSFFSFSQSSLGDSEVSSLVASCCLLSEEESLP